MTNKEEEEQETGKEAEGQTGKPAVSIGGNVSGQVGTGENVIQIGGISGGQVLFNPQFGGPPAPGPTPAGEAPAGPALPPDLYARLRATLPACGPFDDAQNFAALFVQEGLSQWRYDIPEADSTGERVERVIAWLFSREAAGENGLVILLRVLAGRYEEPAGCRQQLETLANDLAQATMLF